MAKRRRVKSGKDKKIFIKSADKTKKININPVVSRGGIRL